MTIMVCFLTCLGLSQEILLNNPSFEDMPHQGGSPYDIGIRGWYDCGVIQFPDETPPDVHPVDYWQVTQTPHDGNTYLGLVVRDNDSWESVSQRLSTPLMAGVCYEIDAYMARSPRYLSGSKELFKKERKEVKVHYTEPTVLRVWGGTGVCGRQELLGESSIVKSLEWEKHIIRLEPSRDYNYITLEAFYEVPVLFPYNGHILLDNLSPIREVPCDDIIVEQTPEPEQLTATNNSEPQPPVEAPPSNQEKPEEVLLTYVPTVKKATAPVSGLGFEKIEKGQIIRIENLYFEMDKTKILKNSYEELDRLYEFLRDNLGVTVEIGGHTNTVPKQDYCIKLSTERAKAVATYLTEKGISSNRIKYKGYGKSQPIIYNDKYDMEARRKNQRVEVKILELG